MPQQVCCNPSPSTLIYSLNGNVAKKTITVNAIPNAGVAIGPLQACRKDSVTYAASITGGRWITSNPVKISLNKNTGRALAADLGTTSIYYVVTNTAGCTDTAVIATTVITVTNLKIGAHVILTDITGKTMIDALVTTRQQTMDIASLAPGVYILKTAGSIHKFIKR
jgi:hypothetical protein